MSTVTIVAHPLVGQHGITRAQRDVLVDAGLSDGEHVELVEGEVPPRRSAISSVPRHAAGGGKNRSP